MLQNEIDVTLVVYDDKSYLISEKLFVDVKNFIDETSRKENFRGKSTLKEKTNFSKIDDFILQSNENLNFQNTLQSLISNKNLENSVVYTKAFIDRKFFSKIISNKNYVPKKMTVMALGLALELKIDEFEDFLASAGYSFMMSSKFDAIIKYCVMNGIYNLVEVDMILDSHGENCFSLD